MKDITPSFLCNILIFLSCFSYPHVIIWIKDFLFNVLVRVSSTFFDKSSQTLSISTGQSLTLYGNETDIFELPLNIFIGGKLELSPIVDIHLYYTSLELEDSSEFSIIQTQEHKFKVIVEQMPSSGCGITPVKGLISIRSQQTYLSSKIIKIISDNSFSYENTSQLELNQPVEIYNLDDLSDWNGYLRITRIQENVVTVDQPILYSSLQKRSEIIPSPLAIFSNADSTDIIFKNTCISARFTEISGVVFLNPQKLNLVGNTIKNCLFMNDSNYTSHEDQIFMLQAQLEQNTFANLTNITLDATLHSITSNVFYKIKNSSIYSPRELESNYFLKSEFKILFEKERHCIFKQTVSHFSRLLISNRMEAVISFQDVFGFKSLFSFSYHINSLILEDSKLIESSFIMNITRISNEIEMKRCYFFYSDNQTSLFYLSRQLQQENEDNFKITIEDCQISGYYRTFFNFSQHPYPSSLIEDMKNPLIIFLRNSTLNIQSLFEGQRFVEGIQTRYITSKFKHEVELILIERQTSETDQQQIKKILFFSQNLNLVHKQESYYKIKDLQNRNFEEVHEFYFQINDSFYQKIQTNEEPFFQILNSQSEELDFQDFSFKSLFLSAFSLEIKNVVPRLIAFGRYQLVFPEFQGTILRIIVTSQYQAKATYLPFESAIFTYEGLNVFVRQNRLIVEWTSDKIQNITLSVVLIYCEQGQTNHGAYCQNECLQKRSDSYCSKRCYEGYHLLNKNNCQQCAFGCKQCTNSTLCLECYENYFRVNGYCYFHIPKGYFHFPAKSLIQCNLSEEDCYERNNCFDCRDMYSNITTEQCKKTETSINSDECFACEAECQHCFGQNKLSCYSCSQESSNYYYGQCI